ncbi:MAG: PilZ domain-containing protein [Myxococcota bacterium]
MDYLIGVGRPVKPETRVPVSIPVVTADGGKPALTKNLSLGGLYLITRRRYAVGSHVELSLSYGGVQLGVTGRVTHLQADGCGFAFVNASVALRNMLRELIDTLLDQRPVVDDDTNPRFVIEHQIHWSRGDAKRHHASIRQLSLAGAYLTSEVRAKKGETLLVYVPGFTATDDGSRASEVRGTRSVVVHEDGEGFGVRFVGASAEFRMAVERLMTSRGR